MLDRARCLARGWRGHALAVALVAVGTGLVAAPLREAAASARFLFFLPFVLGAAWLGGRGPGLVATALAAGASAVLFEAPDGLLGPRGTDGWVRIGGFLVVAGTTVLLLAALQDARRRAEVGVGARDEFVRTVGHELRSPLTVLQARLETQTRRLEERGAPAVNELRDMLIASAHQVRRMERLVARLLDDARLEAGKLVLAPARADLVAIAAAQAAAAQLIDRRHRIVLEAPERAEAVVDPVRVEQVLANLLENAMKFGPRGTAIRVEVAEADGGVRLAVRDAGPGVPPGRRRTLFERGSQAHGAGHGGGLGLGLYVARAVVDAHGGRIWAEFPDEGGSRFVVWLPKIPPRGTRRQEQAA